MLQGSYIPVLKSFLFIHYTYNFLIFKDFFSHIKSTSQSGILFSRLIFVVKIHYFRTFSTLVIRFSLSTDIRKHEINMKPTLILIPSEK